MELSMRSRVVLVIIIIAILCFGLGYTIGFGRGINWAVDVGLNFVEIDINHDMLKDAIFQYKERIGGCYNASILRH